MILIYSTKLIGLEFVVSLAAILFMLALVDSFAVKEHLGLDFAWCWAAVQGSQTRAPDNLSPRKSPLIFWSWQVVSCRRTHSHLQTVHMRTHWCTYPCGCFLTRCRWCVLKESVSFRFFFLLSGFVEYCMHAHYSLDLLERELIGLPWSPALASHDCLLSVTALFNDRDF